MEKPICEKCESRFIDSLDCFYKQFLAVADHLDDSNGKVDKWKYADFLLYVLENKLKKDNPDVFYPDGRKIGDRIN